MARKASTTKTTTTKENTVADNTPDGVTFEIVEELPVARRGSRRSWFTPLSEKIQEEAPGKWVKVREYNSLSTLRSTASGSLKKNFPDFRFSTRKTGEDTGDLFALYAGSNGEHLPEGVD